MNWRGALPWLASGQASRPVEAEPKFPIRSLTGALVFSTLVCVWLGWSGYSSHMLQEAMRKQQVRYEQLHGVIVHLDEVLTMSARMAAATGDEKWEARYRQYEPRLGAAIKELSTLTPDRPAMTRAAAETKKANLSLVEIERRAFDLVESGQTQQARELLLSSAYEGQKQVYAESIATVMKLVAQEMRLADKAEKKHLMRLMAGALPAVAVMLFAWVVTVRRLHVWRASLSTAIHGRAAEAALRRGAEHALSDSETRFRDLVETAQDLIWQCDAEGRYSFLNPAWEKVMGYSVEEMLGHPFSDFQSAEFAERDRGILQRLLEGETVADHETIHIAKDGREVALVFSARLVRDEDGQPAGTRGTAYDITRRKAAETALRESKALLSQAERIARLGSWELDLASGRLTWSEEVFRIFGLAPQEGSLSYETFLERVHPDDRAAVDAAYSESIRDGADSYEIEHRIVRSDTGETRHVHERCFHTKRADGTVVSSIGMVHDITERKRAEETVRRRRRELEAIHEVGTLASKGYRLEEVMNLILDGALMACGTTVGMIFIRDIEAHTLDLVASRGLSEQFVQEFTDRTIVDGEGLTGRIAQQGEVIFIEKDSSHDPRIERMVINEEGLHSFIGVPITAEGETVAVMNILTRPPHTLGEDDVSLVQAVASYVGPAIRNARLFSELERAEEELRGSEKRLREVVDSTPFPVTIVDLQDDRILYWSRSAIELLGHTAPTSEEWYRIAYPDPEYRRQVIARWKPLLEEARASDTPVNAGEYRVTCGDGSVRVCELYANFIPGKLIITFNDITERKAAEADRILLFTAIEQSHESIVITDPKGDILYVNSAFERLTGYSREVALGRNPRILKSGRHDTAFYRNMWETVLSGNVWTGKIVNRRKDGSLFTELTTISPVQDDSGELQAFVAVKRDVTEEEEMRARLAQAQKMESIGRLAGGVAHDFNNLLAVMMSQLDLALLSDDLPTSVSDRFEQIQTSISSAADLTRQLLMFARKQRVIAKKVDLNVVVEVTLKMLRRLIGEDIELSWCPQADLWPVWIDPSQIDQLLANLCVNARDAISGGGKVTVETANLVLDETACTAHDVTPGEWVALTVSDDGAGMSAEVLEHIFEPFFTTKELGYGTGLGLATVDGIAAQNGGFVDVVSEPGKGSRFTVFLPRWKGKESEVEATDECEVPTSAQSGGETVIVVEDEPTILASTLQILQALGYRVLAAATPGEAMRLADEHDGAIDLLLTDVVMPGMNGRELSEHLLTRRPSLRVLYMSGYPADVLAQRSVLDGNVAFLQKPFTLSQLSLKVRSTLDGPST